MSTTTSLPTGPHSSRQPSHGFKEQDDGRPAGNDAKSMVRLIVKVTTVHNLFDIDGQDVIPISYATRMRFRAMVCCRNDQGYN